MLSYTDTELGPKQSILPSGTLLCRDVVIARCGWQDYHESELPFGERDDDGMVHVLWDADQVFGGKAMRSFKGAPVVLTHPDGAVSPENWQSVALGHAQNIRRRGDHLVADLLVSDQRAIDPIRNCGWRGVPAEYEAADQPISRGRLRQTGITGNHIAILPPDQPGRCGSACAIGDQAWREQRTVRTRDTEITAWQNSRARKMNSGTRPALTFDWADKRRRMDAMRAVATRRLSAINRANREFWGQEPRDD